MPYSLEQLLALPKCELHLHLEGVASVGTLWRLKERHQLALPGVESRADLQRRMQVRSLAEFIDCFVRLVQPCLRQPEDIVLLGGDLLAYLERNNVVHAEVFLAPSKLLQQGMPYPAIADALQECALQASRRGRSLLFLVDVSRSFGVENAAANLQLVLQHPREAIVGIGLGGDERRGPAAEFAAVFQRARAHGLRRVAHAGEDLGPDSIRDAVHLLGAERIGHATSLPQDGQLLQELARRRVPIEACPSSNVFTGRYVHDYRQHPVGLFLRQGLNVSVHSDDPTFFGAELNDELRKLHQLCQLTLPQLTELLANAARSSFAPPALKNRLLAALDHPSPPC